jgi:hypothetical protein
LQELGISANVFCRENMKRKKRKREKEKKGKRGKIKRKLK